MSGLEWMPDLAAALDELVPLPSAADADWQDVLSRAAQTRRRGWLRAPRPQGWPRWQIAVVVVVLGLILAAAATATYVAVHSWVSSTPRGPQHSSRYEMSKIVSNPAGESFVLGPGGHDPYFIRDFFPDTGRPAEVWRVSAVDRGSPHRPRRFLDLPMRPEVGIGPYRGLSVGPNGDLFAVGCARRVGREPECNLVLYVVRPDGSQQRILSGSDLVRSRLVPPDGGWWWAPSATAANRLWIAVGPYRGIGRIRLLEVVDPNADNDWSDRVVRPVLLPRSLPNGFWQLAAEPPLPGDDRSQSVLAAVRTTGWRFNIYRIADRNHDGDALDPGEVQQLFASRKSDTAQFTSLLADVNGTARREIAIERGDRISILDQSSKPREIARAFRGIGAVLGGTQGRIYVVAGEASGQAVYRLEPGEASVGSPTSAPASASSAQPAFQLPPRTASGAPRLMFEVTGSDRGESYTIGADGHALQKLVPGTHVYSVCQSVDGREVTFISDAKVPTEFSTYLARDGKQPQRIRGPYGGGSICPFPGGPLPMAPSTATRLLQRAVRATNPRLAAGRFWFGSIAPDGLKFVTRYTAAQSAGNAGGTLELINLRTHRHFRLASLDNAKQFGFLGENLVTWSSDGAQIAYYTEPTLEHAPYRGSPVALRLVVWVRNVATGKVTLRLPLIGRRPFLSLSPSGARLFVGLGQRRILVNLRNHSMRVVPHSHLSLAGWAPSDDKYAFAIGRRVFVSTTNGVSRPVATLPAAYSKHRLLWLGWSPDSRFIAAEADRRKEILTIDTTSGKLTILHPFGQTTYENVSWWRSTSP
jgi:hypothetical protein